MKFFKDYSLLVKQRVEIQQEPNKQIVLADSKINSPFLVKNVNCKLGYFLTGEESFEMNPIVLEETKKRKNTKLFSVIFNLAPGYYHRYSREIRINLRNIIQQMSYRWTFGTNQDQLHLKQLKCL